MAAVRADIGWIWYLHSPITRFQATGAMTSANSSLPAASTKPMANATGQRPTSADTTFIIVGFVRLKGFGDYGICLTSRAAFISGHLVRKKATGIIGARKSQRSSEQLSFEFCRDRRPRLQLVVRAASTRD